MALSVRTRLTIWNGAVTAAIIVGLGVVVYFALAAALMERVDAVLAFEYRETVERLEQLGADDDLGGVPRAFLEEFLLRVSDDAGRVRMQSPALRNVSWEVPAGLAASSGPSFTTVSLSGHGRQRMIYGRAGGTHAGWTVQLASSLGDFEREMAELRAVLLAVLPLGLLIAMAAGYWLAGRALAPVARMTRTAQRIGAANLRQRIATDRPDDELGRLAATLNAMVGRLADSLETTRRFTADASHEFMTPLAQIRAEAEIALQAERSTAEYTEVLESIVDEVGRLTRLADQLLTLAREDAQPAASPHGPVAVDAVVQEAVDAARPAAQRAGIELSVSDTNESNGGKPFPSNIDPDRLRQVLDNLLQNAVRYNRPGGTVRLGLQHTADRVTITVVDTGIGIPADSLPRIFDRFYRVDRSRSRRHGGTGLGLSIARALVENMGGTIEVESTPGQGSTFRIILRRPKFE